MSNPTLINNYYPISYFADVNIAQLSPAAPDTFWASEEKFAPEFDEVTLDLGTSRPMNFIDFEIAQKPIDIQIFADPTGTGDWIECPPTEEFEPSMSVHYLASGENPWIYFEYHFMLVQTRYLKVRLTRRTDPFPFLDSAPARFSIDIRNLRLLHVISTLEEFVPDSGADILGNAYRTDVQSFGPENLVDVTNLLPNGDFGINTAGWSGTNATLARRTTDGQFGTSSLEVTATAASAQATFAGVVTGAPIPRAPYTLSMWVKGVGTTIGKSVHIQINETGGALAAAGFASADVTLTGSWQKITCTGMMQQTDRTSLLAFITLSTSVSSEVYLVDGVQLEFGSTAHDFIPTNGTIQSLERTFWQSQPNPTPFAVEALYFDLRTTPALGSMDSLDTTDVGTLDVRSMSDVELYYEDAVLINEIFIDPVTTGQSMHIYVSNDNEPDWDSKLWTPIPRHFVLKKGYHTLPTPQLARYVKLEFSHLAAAPYNMPEYPRLPQMTYRRYPTWVQNYFNNIKLSPSTFHDPIDRVTIDPLELGFRKVEDRLDNTNMTNWLITPQKATSEVQDFIQGILATTADSTTTQNEVEENIQFNSSWMWQQDLIAQLDTTNFLSRIAQQNETGFNAESEPITEPNPSIQSVTDLAAAKEAKEHPIMWFPQRCRHAYQILKADRPSKIAYFVSVREVSFHRRDYTQPFDEDFFIETFEDSQHVATNGFIQDDWRYVVAP